MKTQQYALYAAEAAVDQGRRFASLAEIQTFVDALRETTWWPERLPFVKKVLVQAPVGRDSVGGYEKDTGVGQIDMAPIHWCELYVCHELAHVLAAANHESKAHCPYFARTYLELVYFVLGSEAFTQLRGAFDAAGIVHDPREG